MPESDVHRYDPGVEQVLNACELDDLPRTSELYATFDYLPSRSVAPKTCNVAIEPEAIDDVSAIVKRWYESSVLENGGVVSETLSLGEGVELSLSASPSCFYRDIASKVLPQGRKIEINISDPSFKTSLDDLAKNPSTIRRVANAVVHFGRYDSVWHVPHRFVDPALRGGGIGQSLLKIIESTIGAGASIKQKDQHVSFTPGGSVNASSKQVGLTLFLARMGYALHGREAKKRLEMLLKQNQDISVGELHLYHDSGLYEGMMFSRKRLQDALNSTSGQRVNTKKWSSDKVFRTVRDHWVHKREELLNNSFGIAMRKTMKAV